MAVKESFGFLPFRRFILGSFLKHRVTSVWVSVEHTDRGCRPGWSVSRVAAGRTTPRHWGLRWWRVAVSIGTYDGGNNHRLSGTLERNYVTNGSQSRLVLFRPKRFLPGQEVLQGSGFVLLLAHNAVSLLLLHLPNARREGVDVVEHGLHGDGDFVRLLTNGKRIVF